MGAFCRLRRLIVAPCCAVWVFVARGARAAIGAIQARLAQAGDDVGGWFEIRRTMNGQIVVVAHGKPNHRQTGPLELFRWVAARYVLS